MLFWFLEPNPSWSLQVIATTEMVMPIVRPPRILGFLKPYVLKMHITDKHVSAQVIHTPTAEVTVSASSHEKLLRPSIGSTRDVAAAAKIGKLLGERLLLRGIPAVSVFLKKEQKYHGKVKAVIDSMRDAGVKLLWGLPWLSSSVSQGNDDATVNMQLLQRGNNHQNGLLWDCCWIAIHCLMEINF